MDLGKYIHQLLKHRKEVYVVGLGVFKRIHTSSVYDDDKGVYLPPLTYLEFDNKSVEGFDFLDYVQQTDQLDRAEAEALVGQEVAILFDSIKDTGSVSLNHLGQFIKHGNSLVFKAEDISGFNMSPVQSMTSLEQEIRPDFKEDATIQTDSGETAKNQDTEQDLDVTSIAAEQIETEDPGPDRSSGKTSWYIWAALLAIVIIGSLFYYNRSRNIELTQEPEDTSKTVAVQVDSVISLTPDSLINQTTLVGDSDTIGKKVYSPLIPLDHTYQIVIGTHATLAQAYEQAESFNKAGLQSVRVIPSNLANNKKKVIWDSYATKSEADSALKYVRKHYVSDAWHQKVNK